MRESVNQLTVEKVMNGFQVYLQDYRHNGTVRPVPYVFETMYNLLDFIKKSFDNDTNK